MYYDDNIYFQMMSNKTTNTLTELQFDSVLSSIRHLRTRGVSPCLRQGGGRGTVRPSSITKFQKQGGVTPHSSPPPIYAPGINSLYYYYII